MSQESNTREQDIRIMDQNSSISSTDEELRELCMLLDEERYKMHQLAEQWKHFGTSTIHKLASQIVDYQKKLNDLEQRQISLLKENESLKSLASRMTSSTTTHNNTHLINKPIQQNVGTQTFADSRESIITSSLDDSLQGQISVQNMFDAIKTAEIYESIEHMTIDDTSKKLILKDFCNLIWKYLEERSKPKSSCLL